jgi:hypothetical protein
MKKLLVSAMVMVSLISNAQVVEKQTTYVLKMTEQEYNNYINSSKPQQKHKSISVHKQTTNKSFGGVAGYSMMLGEKNSINNMSWGSWLDFGKLGVEYNASVQVANITDISNSIITTGTSVSTTTTTDILTGAVSRNIGAFIKMKSNAEFYYGGGVQINEMIGVRNKTLIRNGIMSIYNPEVYDDTKVLPYATFGYITKLNQMFCFKAGIIVSKTCMVNAGIGFNL